MLLSNLTERHSIEKGCEVLNNDFYLAHHGVKGMKWGVRKKSSVSTKTKSDNQTDEALVVKKAKRKKALTIAGYTAATVAISVAGVYAVRSPKIRGLVGKGMDYFNNHKETYDEPIKQRMFRDKATGTLHDVGEFFDFTTNPDGSPLATKKPGINLDDYEWGDW